MNNTTRSTQSRGETRPSYPQRKAFVIQFSADAGPQTGLFRGRVEQVISGEQATFESTDQLWAFVRGALLQRSEQEMSALPPARERAA